MPSGRFLGFIDENFTAVSADGFGFRISAEGRWRRTMKRQHNPASAASDHIIGEVKQLARTFSITADKALESKANARLGCPAKLHDNGVRVLWARIYVNAEEEDQYQAKILIRAHARAESDRDEQRVRIAQAVALRDLLREDPTLALAYLLLESPARAAEFGDTIAKISEQIAANAPGAAWVKTARLLEEFFQGQPPDAKQFMIERVCLVLIEFGEKRAARQIMIAHGLPASRVGSDEPLPDRLL